MNIRAISESIRELLAEQNHDVTNITIDSIRNRIIALNNIAVQFVKIANQNEALSTELGVTNTEVLQLHQFAEYIARLNDYEIGFYTNLNDCKLVNKERLLHALAEIQESRSISETYNAMNQEAKRRQIEVLDRLINEINY
jgi:uncharacterized protein YigA (DUF484 family)